VSCRCRRVNRIQRHPKLDLSVIDAVAALRTISAAEEQRMHSFRRTCAEKMSIEPGLLGECALVASAKVACQSAAPTPQFSTINKSDADTSGPNFDFTSA